MSKSKKIDLKVQDVLNLYQDVKTQLKVEDLDSLDIVRVKNYNQVSIANSVGIITFPDKKEVLLFIGTVIIKLRDYSELKSVLGSLMVLTDNALTAKDLHKVCKRAEANHEYIDVIQKESIYNHLKDDGVELVNTESYMQNLFLSTYKMEDDMVDNYEKVVEQLKYNTNSMNSEFSKQVTDNKQSQEMITGQSVESAILTKASISSDPSLKQGISDLAKKFYDLYQTIAIKMQHSNVDSRLASDSQFNDESGDTLDEIGRVSEIADVHGNFLDLAIEGNLTGISGTALNSFKETLEKSIDVMSAFEVKVDAVISGIDEVKVAKFVVNFDAQTVIDWTRDPNKGVKYAEEQLSRLPKHEMEAMLTEIKKILDA